jgi:phosphoribosylglycinamide formyltransferase-1
MKNIAVFASGRGTNLQAIIDQVKRGALQVNLKLVVSDRRKAMALERAKKAGIKTLYVDPGKFKTRQAYEQELLKHLAEERIDLIVLAGFMRILSPFLVRKFRNRILNIHPALLPAFKGGEAIKDAFRYGVKVTGVTVHLVDEKVDHGPILIQEPVIVSDRESIEELEARIHCVEHRIYPEAIKKMASGRIRTRGRKALSSRLRSQR